jgi:DeoR/GlpR family transcriptional regulator of sugar metabolism
VALDLLKTQRQKEIVDLMEDKKVMTISEMAQVLNVSMMTIRRDLEELEESGVIKKVHGGAVLFRKEKLQPSFFERVEENNNEKGRIGRKAASMIHSGNIVFFDSSTTNLSVIDFIADDLEFTAITNGLMTAQKLCSKQNINVIFVGGEIHHSSFTAINNTAIDLIKKFNTDIALISTKAFLYPEGIFEAELPLIDVKRAIVEMTKKVILLADHSKFESKSLSLSVKYEKIDVIITDSNAPKEILNMISKDGKELFIV